MPSSEPPASAAISAIAPGTDTVRAITRGAIT
jgi:hypothetical protein